MSERLPWSVKGIEPEIRDDAARAAQASGMTLGQWLNGVIRDSLVDLRAARQRPVAFESPAAWTGVPPRAVPAHFPVPPQQEMASPPMPPFQQPYPYAPPPQGPYAGPPYAQPYAPAYDPHGYAPRGYDPVEARLSHYARMAQAGPAPEERVLGVVDAAVGAMEKSVRESERKTAAALDSIMAMMQQVQQGLPTQTAPRAPAPAPASVPAAAPDASEALSAQLATLMDRLAALESGIAGRNAAREPVTADPLSQARRIESQLGDALDALGEGPGAPVAGGVRPPPGRGGVRPRVNVVRGGAAAVADIAARQRALDTDAAPKAMLSAETQALEAIRRSIAALADQVRETKEDQARQPDVDLRTELKDLQKSVQDLAPRRIVASINESLRALAGKIEQSRQDGVRESQLAPIEKLLSDMRASIEQVREPRGLDTINGAIAHLGRRIEDIGARSVDSAQMREFQQQVADIRTLISEVQAQSPVASLEDRIARLAHKLDTLAERPGDGRAVATVMTAVETLRQQIERIDPERALTSLDRRISDLAGRIETAAASGPSQDAIDTLAQRIDRRMAGIESLGQRIESLASQLDRPRSPAPDVSDLTQRIERRMAGIDTLAARIDTLAQRIDTAPAGEGSQVNLDLLVGRIDAMREALASHKGGSDLTALERRIGDLQTTLEKKVPTQPDVKGLELILRKLAERIETVRAPVEDSRALDALQTQIMALAEKLDRSGPAVPGLAGLEKTIGDLCRVVGGIKDSAVSAAQDAARAAASESAGSMGMDPLAAEGMLLIKRDLSEMKAAQAESEARSRDAMRSVGDLLERVASRLGTLESELASPRQAAPATRVPAMTEPQAPAASPDGSSGRPAPQLARPLPTTTAVEAAAPKDLAAPPRGPMPSTAADPSLDLPLEPGAGWNQAGAPGPGAAEPEPSDPRASFIAAARRAAQAAANQSSAVLADVEGKIPGGKAAKEKGAAKFAGLQAAIAKRRKPILLGLAALIFALGGLKIATSFLMPDDSGAEPSVQIEEPKKESRAAPARLPAAAGPTSLEAALPAKAAPSRETASSTPDRTAVGSITDQSVAAAAPPAAVSAPLPPAAETPATTPAKPLDVAELMKQTPFKGPERLKQAAMNGNLAAVYEIGARHADGRGVARDLKVAAKWLEAAASQGYAPAQYRFGSFNREGLGLQQDAKVAFQWFMKAAEQGHILAMHNLAVLYAEGVTGSPDYGAAAAWFRNAAEHGVKDSQFNIAILHVRGLGVAQDMVEAYKWFAIAAQQGDADAIKRRDEVAARLSPTQLTDAKGRVEEFRPRRPDMRANEVTQPEGGWDQAPRAPGAGQSKKTRA